MKRTVRIVLSTPAGIVGALIVVVLLVAFFFQSLLAPHDPYLLDVGNKLRAPDAEYWLGTDTVGRDVFSRIIYGARFSLAAGTIVVGIGITLGSIVGLFAAYPGGRRGELIMRVTDIFLAFPTMLLAIALASTLGPSFINSMIAISIVYWPKYARLVYGQALSIRETDYVRFPNCSSALIVQATLDFGDAILFFAALSFVGLGAQPPAADWGAMLAFARKYMMLAWWTAVFPGLAIFITVLGFNLLGDSLRDAFDPRLRRLKQFRPLRFTWLGDWSKLRKGTK
jgi:peptide/nickel transport system permease protein